MATPSSCALNKLRYHPPISSNWSTTAPTSSDASEQYWLKRPGALTAGLRKLGKVDLRVVAEHEETLTSAECWMLQRPESTPMWVREIIMAIDGIDSVFARSFTPLEASLGLWSGMRQLQTRPLADMLYNDPEITRSSFYTCRLTTDEPMYRSAQLALGEHCPAADQLFARASVFQRQEEPLLVAECFLPHFWDIARSDV